MEVGAKVWAAGGPDLWQAGSVTHKSEHGDKLVVKVTLEKGGVQEYTVSAKEDDDSQQVKLRNVAGQASIFEGAAVADLTTLTHLHEPAILYSLLERYNKNTIYTYTGPILLAVNPFKKVDLYTDKILTSYKSDGERRLYDPEHPDLMPPHVYALADKAYRNMIMPTTEYNMRSQSILVSGESGAGKTETCKIIMKYLAILGNASGDAARLGQMETQVLKSNPILEAFGNARTVRNDNSSRFGKYIQMLFNEYGKLSGAAIKTFLLEKIRVVKQSQQERNYHVFYALDAGAKGEDRTRWGLKGCRANHYLNQSGCYDRRDGVKDSDLYTELMDAFKAMGFTPDQWTNCFDIVAAVLALGDVVFVGSGSGRDDTPQAMLSDSSKEAVETAARLLGVTSADIIASLTSRQVTAGLNHQVTIYLSPEQANHARDALSKAVYAAMFDYVVQRTNEAIDGQQTPTAGGSDFFNTSKTFIGLLDIFGFEIFKENYYEQFLINYANEVLQQQFNNFVFRQEQEEYRREQIQWTFIAFPDNKDCIELIEKKPNGIIPTLDEQCLIGKATDDRFARELYKKCEGNDRFDVTNKMRVDHQFCIKHYAGNVPYSSAGIIEKNRDTLQQEGVDLLMSSSNEFVQLMGDIEANSAMPAAGGAHRRTKTRGMVRVGSARTKMAPRRSTIGAKSLGTQFKENLNNLVRVINQTHPHYVRCIKPNDQLVPAKFDFERIAEQLRNAGVLEVVRVARAGFPVRLGIQEFIDRYGMLAVTVVEAAYRRAAHEGEGDQDQAVCRALMRATLSQMKGGPVDNGADFATVCREQGIQMGLTKVFFQQKAFNKIEKLRTAIVSKAALRIQTFFRCANQRRKYLVAMGIIVKKDDNRRIKNMAAFTIQKRMKKWMRGRRMARARAEAAAMEEAKLRVQLAALREEMQAEIDALKAQLTSETKRADSLQTLPARVIVVAGGAHGVGPAVAARLVAEGAKVVVADVGAETARATIKGPECCVSFVEMDCRSEESIKAAFASAKKTFGVVDGLVNIPAQVDVAGSVDALDMKSWQAAMAVNTEGPLLCMKHGMAQMKAIGGAIVNVATAVSASPAGGIMAAVTRSVAASAGQTRVNCVVHTVGGKKVAPVGRCGTPEDVAAQVVNLLAEKSGFITGQTVTVDGGLSVL